MGYYQAVGVAEPGRHHGARDQKEAGQQHVRRFAVAGSACHATEYHQALDAPFRYDRALLQHGPPVPCTNSETVYACPVCWERTLTLTRREQLSSAVTRPRVSVLDSPAAKDALLTVSRKPELLRLKV